VIEATLAGLFPAHIEAVGRRTAEALARSGYRGLLVHSGCAPAVFLDDQTYPFRAHAPFKVWVPQPELTDALVYFEPGRLPTLIFQTSDDYWHKPAAVPESWWTGSFDIRPARSREAARAALPASLGQVAYIGEPFPELLEWGLGAINPRHLMLRLDFARAAKSPYELACLREASRLGVLGHRAAAAAFSAGGSEFDIHQAFLAGCSQREQELPYNAIVALNEGGSVLHYQVLERRPPQQHRSLLIDAGAGFAGYGSDITRTLSSGDPDFTALVAAMDRLQQRLCGQVRAGVEWCDMHLAAVAATAELLCEAGILRCSVEQALEQRIANVFFPHGIGHLLGLQVHDVGGLQASPEGGELPRPAGHPALRLTRRLEAGFVVTMEPGIYFIDPLLQAARAGPQSGAIDWGRVEALRPFGGIRIEDDLVVTADGCENLTRRAFSLS
jgi:Xaa-Pro dipeptidase